MMMIMVVVMVMRVGGCGCREERRGLAWRGGGVERLKMGMGLVELGAGVEGWTIGGNL